MKLIQHSWDLVQLRYIFTTAGDNDRSILTASPRSSLEGQQVSSPPKGQDLNTHLCEEDLTPQAHTWGGHVKCLPAWSFSQMSNKHGALGLSAVQVKGRTPCSALVRLLWVRLRPCT